MVVEILQKTSIVTVTHGMTIEVLLFVARQVIINDGCRELVPCRGFQGASSPLVGFRAKP